MTSRKILIVTYYWPPSGGVGVQRWMNFALQLKEKAWEPIILTPENPQFEIKDETLVRKVKDIQTCKLPIWEPVQLFHNLTGNKERSNVQQGLVMEKSNRTVKDKLAVWIRGNLLLPDPRVFWVKKATNFAVEFIKKEGISTVITTGPPHSMHLIGRSIKNKTQVKWLADFRDPWSKWDILSKLNTTSLAMNVHEYLERSVLKQADNVITVSARLAKALGNVEVLNNGVSALASESINTDESHFTLGYFGMLNELRNPSKLWMLLDQMCRENPYFASRLKIKIGGIVSASIKDDLLKLQELKNKIQFLGYLSHDALQLEYQKCNLLLLLLNKSNNSRWILPVKFFEYLAAKRMILCLGQRESDLGDIMNKKDLGEIFSYNEIESIRSFIEDVFENKRGPSLEHLKSILVQFSHRNLVEKLEELLFKLHVH
ncbi:MAG: glycosyl transferase family 1 [Bacteroidota bacterium]